MSARHLLPLSRAGLAHPARWLLALLAVPLALALSPLMSRAEHATAIPPPAVDETVQPGAGSEKVVLAGGCFWGVQAVFQHLKGVTQAVSGYAGGAKDTAEYEMVSTGRTGHAESVEVTFDPSVITYGTILRIYFSVAHDPTELNRQGPDTGPQYRSAIFPSDEQQRKIAELYIAQLDKAGLFKKPIATRIEGPAAFYPAEGYHQNYATLHPDSPYIAYNDLPKLDNLKRIFPELYRPAPVLVTAARGVD